MLAAVLAGPVVTFVKENNLIAAVELRTQQADKRCHPAGKQDAFFGSFERGQFLFDDLLARRPVATVLTPFLVLFNKIDDRLSVFECERRRHHNGIGNRINRFLSSFSGVDGDG